MFSLLTTLPLPPHIFGAMSGCYCVDVFFSLLVRYHCIEFPTRIFLIFCRLVFLGGSLVVHGVILRFVYIVTTHAAVTACYLPRVRLRSYVGAPYCRWEGRKPSVVTYVEHRKHRSFDLLRRRKRIQIKNLVASLSLYTVSVKSFLALYVSVWYCNWEIARL